MDRAGLDELLRKARRRDPDALSELVAAYSGRIFGLVFRLTGSRDAAEDLLQETMVRVVRAIHEYDHVGKFESWLFRIAANLARDRARQRGRRGETAPLEVAAARAAGADDGGPEERLLRAERGEQLAAALELLSEGEREVLVLRHYSELSFREIADLLKIPLGTALARAHRGLQRLRRELEDEDDRGA